VGKPDRDPAAPSRELLTRTLVHPQSAVLCRCATRGSLSAMRTYAPATSSSFGSGEGEKGRINSRMGPFLESLRSSTEGTHACMLTRAKRCCMVRTLCARRRRSPHMFADCPGNRLILWWTAKPSFYAVAIFLQRFSYSHQQCYIWTTSHPLVIRQSAALQARLTHYFSRFL
jgi:hypothetical protein